MANSNVSPKLIKKDFYVALQEFVGAESPAFKCEKGEITAEQMAEFIAHELELLTKKNVGEKKPTAQQIANKQICDGILAGMEDNRLYQIADMMKEIPACEGLSSQRVTALVKQMLDISIERIEDKRKAFFRKIIK